MSAWVRFRHPGPVLKLVESVFICAAMSNDRKELLALYALGALDGDDLIVAEAYVAEGAPADLADLRAYEHVTGLLGWSATPVAPPVGLRPRVVDELGARRSAPAPIPFRPRADVVEPARPSRFGAFAAFASLAAAATIAAIFLGLALYRSSAELEATVRQLADARAAQTQQREDLERANKLLGVTQDPALRVTRLTTQGAAPEPTIDVHWNPEQKSGVLVARNLPKVEPSRTYELWLLDGGAPIPAGTFNTDANGTAIFEIDRLTAAGEPKNFAITVEPAGGSPAPTSKVLLIGEYRGT